MKVMNTIKGGGGSRQEGGLERAWRVVQCSLKVLEIEIVWCVGCIFLFFQLASQRWVD